MFSARTFLLTHASSPLSLISFQKNATEFVAFIIRHESEEGRLWRMKEHIHTFALDIKSDKIVSQPSRSSD